MSLALDTVAWGWPQWVTAISYAIGALLSAALHGHKRTGEHSFPISLVVSAIGIFVLTAGGFFG